jgi:putative FmdB family regulatory protein
MPTYDYECNSCGNHWELFQKITDDPIKKCPKCGKNSAQRQFGTGAAIVFKGSGFYQTDYRSDSYKKAAKAAESGSGESGTAKGSDGKSESKGTESAGTKKSSESSTSSKPDAKD